MIWKKENTLDKQPQKKQKTEFMEAMGRLKKNKSAMAGAIILLLLIILAILSPVLTPYRYDMMDVAHKCQGPSLAHPFGTDDLGRDILSRVLYGARYSLSLGVVATLGAAALGVVIGAISGFFAGRVDNLIMRLLDIIQAVPNMLLLICVSAALGNGYFNTLVAMSVTQIPAFARLLRASVLKVRGEEYVEAANAIGCSTFRQITKYVLPNSFAPMLVSCTMGVASTILSTSALSYIGLGIQPPTPEWGAMLAGAKTFIRSYPYMLMFPGLFIMITVLGLNMFGDGLRDALDPKLKD